MVLWLVTLLSVPAFAHTTIVVSDLHLMLDQPDHANQRTYEKFLKILDASPELGDLVVNGDVYHAPTVGRLTPEERIERITERVVEIKSHTRARVHFNVGNHDELWDAEFKNADPEFSRALTDAIAAAGIDVIGRRSSEIYAVTIGHLPMLISHTPFARTALTTAQSERFRGNARAHKKVNDVELIARGDGVTRVMSDSHTPLEDRNLRVFNSGKLALTGDLPDEPNTILTFDAAGCGALLTVD